MLLTMRRLAAAVCVITLAACAEPQQAQTQEAAVESENISNLVISTPTANARVSSPLIVEGAAPGDWYFEAQFPVRLIGADGAVIAEAPAQAQSDWMTEAPVPYRAELPFAVTQETPATLVLQEDMPADNANPREVTIPIVLAPPP